MWRWRPPATRSPAAARCRAPRRRGRQGEGRGRERNRGGAAEADGEDADADGGGDARRFGLVHRLPAGARCGGFGLPPVVRCHASSLHFVLVSFLFLCCRLSLCFWSCRGPIVCPGARLLLLPQLDGVCQKAFTDAFGEPPLYRRSHEFGQPRPWRRLDVQRPARSLPASTTVAWNVIAGVEFGEVITPEAEELARTHTAARARRPMCETQSSGNWGAY